MLRSIRVMAVLNDGETADRICAAIRQDPSLSLAASCCSADEALGLAAETDPDVVVLGFRLVNLECAFALRQLMRRFGIPVLALHQHASAALPALDAGADGFLLHPAIWSESEGRAFLSGLLDRIKVLALRRTVGTAEPPSPIRLVVAVASQGWQVQLASLLKALPAGFPPVMAALSSRCGKTGDAAEILQAMCGIQVAAGADGIKLVPGRAVLANLSLGPHVIMDQGECYLSLTGNPHNEPADVLFRSAADAAGGALAAVSFSGEGVAGLAAAVGHGGIAVVHNKHALLRASGYVHPQGLLELALEDIPALIASSCSHS